MRAVHGIVQASQYASVLKLTASGRSGESLSGRRYVQHYGLQSMPKVGAEVIALVEGSRIVFVASADRRYELTLQEGEVALYSHDGSYVHLCAGGHMDVHASQSVNVDTTDATVTASGSCVIDCPDIKAGSPSASKRLVTWDELQQHIDGHVHLVSGVTSTPPTTQLPTTSKTTRLSAE